MSWRRCPHCRSWQKCKGYDFFEPKDINFCRIQMMWLCSHLLMLGSGVWPPDPKTTGYIEQPGFNAPGVRGSGGFETPAGIAGEVGRRLKFTGWDGDTLMHEIVVLNAERYEDLSRSAKNALNYVVGVRAKNMKYNRWLVQRSWRNKSVGVPQK